MKRSINPAEMYGAVETAKDYTKRLQEAVESGKQHTLKVGSRIYRAMDGGIDYHSENGQGRYYYPKTWRTVYDYILQAVQTGYIIKEIINM